MFALREELDEVDDRGEVRQLADNILAYLRQHSQAADSLEGIREWSLNTESFVPTQLLERALNLLVNQGLMERIQAADGIALYRGAFVPESGLELVG